MSDPTPDLDQLDDASAVALLDQAHAEPDRQAPDPDHVDQTPIVDDTHQEA